MSSDTPTDMLPNPLIDYILARNPRNLLEMRKYANTVMLADFNNNLPEIGRSIDDIVIAKVDGSDVTVDVHVPKGDRPFPIVIYFHGGAWSSGSRKTHRKLCHRIAEAGLLVFNIDYRLAPEHPFPAALDDSKRAYDWVLEHAEKYGGDLQRLAVSGDSAGGLLACSLAVEVGGTSSSRIKALGLLYPALEFESWPQTIATVPAGIPNMNGWVFDVLLTEEHKKDLSNPRLSPINAADKFPPTFITCSRQDATVYDACEALPIRLEEAGISCASLFYEDLPHGFIQMEEMFPQAQQTIRKMTDFLLEHLQLNQTEGGFNGL